MRRNRHDEIVDLSLKSGIIMRMSKGSGFTRCERLSLKKDFDAVFRDGRKEADNNLVVRVLRTGHGYARLGMAVGKKHGHAVGRNRLKRLIREAFRLNRSQLPDSVDLVVIPREGAKKELPAIAESLIELSQRAVGAMD